MGDGHPRTIYKSNWRKEILIVGIDYFTKWIEAEPTTQIKASQVKRFI